jgi:hypothetical protein
MAESRGGVVASTLEEDKLSTSDEEYDPEFDSDTDETESIDESDGEDPYLCLCPPHPPEMVLAVLLPDQPDMREAERVLNSENLQHGIQELHYDAELRKFAWNKFVLEGRTRSEEARITRSKEEAKIAKRREEERRPADGGRRATTSSRGSKTRERQGDGHDGHYSRHSSPGVPSRSSSLSRYREPSEDRHAETARMDSPGMLARMLGSSASRHREPSEDRHAEAIDNVQSYMRGSDMASYREPSQDRHHEAAVPGASASTSAASKEHTRQENTTQEGESMSRKASSRSSRSAAGRSEVPGHGHEEEKTKPAGGLRSWFPWSF